MAGMPGTKERNRVLQDEVTQLRAKLAAYEHEGRAKRLEHHRRSYDETILDDLMEWSTEGQFLDEVISQWGISRETFDQWCEQEPKLQELLPIARARARAALLRHMRAALSQRSAFPAALADRIIAMLDKEMMSGGTSDSQMLVSLEMQPLRHSPP